METKIGGKSYHFFGPGPLDFVMKEKELKGVGKRSLEWDLNDWKWDGDLFIASSLNSAPSDCQRRQLFPVEAGIPAISVLSNSSSSCSDEINLGCERGKRELEKRRREDLFENGELNNGSGSLSLKLGGNGYPIIEGEVGDGKNGKKTKLVGTSSSRAICQVEDCNADLTDAKDYHRRHKVCDMHSKATTALVSNVMQRFCQQCSRFHVLQEFDDGKRSCRRRLAGHNRRRRKTNPDSIVNGSSLNDTQTTSYLLISLLRILSNMHSNSSDQAKDQDILSHLLKNLANLTSTLGGSNFSGLLQKSQDLLNVGTSVREVSEVVPTWLSNGSEPSRHVASTSKVNGGIGDRATPEMSQNGILTDSAQVGPLKAISLPKTTSTFQIKDTLPPVLEAPELTTGRMRLNNFDLNNIYNDSEDFVEGFERVQRDSHHSSPPQTSDNSDSASARSPSSSSGDGQSRTDRIVFKLFGKDPNDLPIVLRAQILNWLSSSPTDIESYIRPGCIILTVYLRLAESTWDELCCDLSSSLIRFLDVSHNKFWRTGWVYTRVQHRMAFMYNGQVVLDTLLPLKSHNHCRISSIKPIAVSVSEAAQFTVKGFNLSHPTTRLLCALEGKYLIQEATHDLVEGTNTFKEHDELQCLSFSCSIPNILGRGFIEVEEHGLSSSFFPFIVAEQNICSEIRMLEEAMDITESEDKVEERTAKIEAKNQALDFIHELGWLLHRSHSRSRLGHMDPNADGFQFTRFKSLVEFSMGHDWCALVKKLLDIFLNGIVDAGEYPSVKLALSDMCLLHRAVRRNCKPMVELLLRYLPGKESYQEGYEKEEVESGGCSFLFRPDIADPTGLTPLHIAASIDGSESILDALTEDPGSVGIKAWNSARDNTGFTPENYARLRGHFSYIHLVQRKINKKSEAKHVILDIPSVLSGGNINQKPPARSRSGKLVSNFQIEKIESKPIPQYCKLCDQQLAYGNMSTSLVYRPAMLSMVAIAAVCVCVGLLFKSSPEVLFGPFRWELLDYGTI